MTRTERELAIRERLCVTLSTFDEAAPLRLAIYHDMLVDWSTRMNLTGNADFEIVLDRHYMDSLAPLQVKELFKEGATLVDVGSGAGFPGLPLAIVRPDLHVTLLDSLGKRIGFLDAVRKELGLKNVSVLHARAEEAAHSEALREAFDVAVARAVAPLAVLCELLLPFVRVDGKMICYKGPAARQELEAGDRAAAILGGGELKLIPILLPSQGDWQHTVVVSEKKQKTVRQYPRKPGIPGRIPLGISDKS